VEFGKAPVLSVLQGQQVLGWGVDGTGEGGERGGLLHGGGELLWCWYFYL